MKDENYERNRTLLNVQYHQEGPDAGLCICQCTWKPSQDAARCSCDKRCRFPASNPNDYLHQASTISRPTGVEFIYSSEYEAKSGLIVLIIEAAALISL